MLPANKSEPDIVCERFLRRKLPAEMNAAADAGVGVGGCESDAFRSEDLESASEVCFWRFDGAVDCAVDGTGATSLDMRASMKVTKVKETLCAGE